MADASPSFAIGSISALCTAAAATHLSSAAATSHAGTMAEPSRCVRHGHCARMRRLYDRLHSSLLLLLPGGATAVASVVPSTTAHRLRLTTGGASFTNARGRGVRPRKATACVASTLTGALAASPDLLLDRRTLELLHVLFSA